MQTLIQWVTFMADPLARSIHSVGRTLVISLLIRLISNIFTLTRYPQRSDSRYYGAKLIYFSGYRGFLH